jgi:hypothetical protein
MTTANRARIRRVGAERRVRFGAATPPAAPPRRAGSRGLRLCESCRRAPATTIWTHPGAGAPFALCAGCAPASDPGATA